MRVVRVIIIVVLVLMSITTVSAQERMLLSRAALDSLINPSLSKRAAGALTATRATLSLGVVKDTTPQEVCFTLNNNTDSRITLSDVSTTCGCLRVLSSPNSIEAGTSATIKAQFNPSGRNGSFSIDIMVYTTLDDSHPTTRLTITGVVEQTERYAHFRESMGTVRMTRRTVRLTQDTRTEHITCINTGDTPVTLTARSTVEYLTFSCEPAVLNANERGDIIIRYDGNKPTYPIKTILVVEGVECAPTERMIKVTIE